MADIPNRKADGRYDTKGLSPKEFVALFQKIKQQDQRKRRLFARKNILTPSMLKNKSLDDVLGLGRKRSGVYFTREDLFTFEKRRAGLRERFDYKTAGIPYQQLISASRKIDVDRANNKVTDGRGITNANLLGFKKNTVLIRVAASQASIDDHHMVELRLEEWDQAIENVTEDKANNRLVARSVAAGRMSIQCDCGRFKYWYRYIATVGNFVLAPPKEFAYPKDRNAKGYGVACKHIIHAATRLQSAAWQNFIITALKQQSKSNAYGDDRRTTTKYLTEEEQKRANQNRKSQTNLKEARANFTRYRKRMAELEKKQREPEAQQLLSQLKVSRKQNDQMKAELRRLKKEQSDSRKMAAQAEKDSANALKLRKQNFVDTLRAIGQSKEQANKAWDEFVKRGG